MDQVYALRCTNTLSPSLIRCNQTFQPASNLEGYYRVKAVLLALTRNVNYVACWQRGQREKSHSSLWMQGKSGLTGEKKTWRKRGRRREAARMQLVVPGCQHEDSVSRTGCVRTETPEDTRASPTKARKKKKRVAISPIKHTHTHRRTKED